MVKWFKTQGGRDTLYYAKQQIGTTPLNNMFQSYLIKKRQLEKTVKRVAINPQKGMTVVQEQFTQVASYSRDAGGIFPQQGRYSRESMSGQVGS